MRRRTLFVGGFGAILGGCAKSGQPPAGGSGQPAVLPSGQPILVAGLTVSGGFLPQGFDEFAGPRLAVYSDGTAIADARHQLDIGTEAAAKLVGDLRTDLAGLPSTATPGGKNMIMDAATTRIDVLAADGSHHQVSAYALQELDYTAALKRADSRLQTLAKQVSETGKPYTAQRIRIIAVPAMEGTATASWPTGVQVPPPSSSGLRQVDITGPAVQQIAAVVPASAPGDQWLVISTATAGNLSVAWRYLLPSE